MFFLIVCDGFWLVLGCVGCDCYDFIGVCDFFGVFECVVIVVGCYMI